MQHIMMDFMSVYEKGIYMIPETRKAASGYVRIRVKAFGLNRADLKYAEKNMISGMECAGEIAEPSDSDFCKGQKVIVIPGVRADQGSGTDSEYVRVSADRVFAANTELSWKELAAVPVSFLGVWCMLFEKIHLKCEDVLLVRGAVSSAGLATIQMAKALGCKVIAATEKAQKIPLLEQADAAVLDTENLTEIVPEITKILDLREDAMLYKTLADIPTQEIVDNMFAFVKEHKLRPHIEKLFDFADIQDAAEALESGGVDGKIVVVVHEEEDEETTKWLNELADLFG